MDCMVPAHAEVPPTHHPHQKLLYSSGGKPQTQAGFQTGSVVKTNWIYASCDVRWQYAAMLKTWYTFQCSRNIWHINQGASARWQLSILLTYMYIIAAVDVYSGLCFVSQASIVLSRQAKDLITGKRFESISWSISPLIKWIYTRCLY